MAYSRASSNVRIIRMILIFIKLIRRETITSSSLADEFDVSRRTIKRDLELLRDVPVSIGYDTGSRTYYLDGNGSFQLNKFTSHEILVMLFGLELMKKAPLDTDKSVISPLSQRLFHFLPEKERNVYNSCMQMMEEILRRLAPEQSDIL